jgi:hypothetical protein
MIGMVSSVPGNQGSGWWKKARPVAMAMTSAPSIAVQRSGSEVAEMMTGAVIRSAKGLVSPPVM